jgi:hypothetical protein
MQLREAKWKHQFFVGSIDPLSGSRWRVEIIVPITNISPKIKKGISADIPALIINKFSSIKIPVPASPLH